MRDDAMCGGIVNAGKRLEVVDRRTIDVDGALLLHAFNHTLRHGLGIASRGRGGACCLLADFVGASLMRGATGKNERNQEYEGRIFHVYLDADEGFGGKRELDQLKAEQIVRVDARRSRSNSEGLTGAS